MKNIYTYAIFATIIAIMQTGCGPVLYTNVGQNVPMFIEKDEFSFTGSYAAAGSNGMREGTGLGLSAAYSFSDKWAGITSFYSINFGEDKDDPEFRKRGTYFELGGGRYGSFASGRVGWEVFGGLGFCGIRNEDGTERINVGFIKPFVQPSIGYLSPYFDLIFTPRVAMVGYTKKDIRTTDVQYRRMANDFFEQHGTSLVFEPGITVRAGYKNTKVFLQTNYSTFKNEFEGNTVAANNFVNVGVNLLFSNNKGEMRTPKKRGR